MIDCPALHRNCEGVIQPRLNKGLFRRIGAPRVARHVAVWAAASGRFARRGRLAAGLAVLALFCLSNLALSNHANGSDTAIQLQTSVARMKDWLGTSSAAEGWRRYLLLNTLETQAALGDRADIQTLNEVLSRFQSGAPGLDHSGFQDVRRDIEEHVRHLAQVRVGDLETALVAAKDQFRPLDLEAVLRRKEDALYHLQALEKNYQTRLAEPERSEAVNALQLGASIETVKAVDPAQVLADGLAAETGDAAADQARQAARNQAISQLRGHVQKFDESARERFDPWFGSAQLALDRYFRVLFYASDRNLKQGYERQLQTLSETLPLLADPQERRAAGVAGNAVGFLDFAGQVPELVTALRMKYSQPNFQGVIKEDFLNRAMGRDVPETRPVREVILGRLIQGTSYTDTNVSFDLQDDPNQVSLSIRALGTIRSDNFTKQGPVTAYSGSTGVFEARRHVFANLGGFYANAPYAAANLQSEFRGTSCKLKVVNKLAHKTYVRDRELSQSIGAGRAEDRILNQFGQQTNESLSQPRQRLNQAITRMNEYSRLVPDLFLSSRSEAVVVNAKRADAFRLGSPRSAPEFAVPSDVQLRLHESLLSNYLDPFFAGRTLTNEDMAKQAEKLLDRVPEAFVSKGDDDRWSITFAPIQAVQANIEDNRVILAINGRRFSQADREMRAAMIIRIAYRVVQRDGKVLLERDGQVTVDYEDPADESARTLAFKTFLTDKLNSADAADEGIVLPANLLPTDRVKELEDSEIARQMQLVEFTADDGWLKLGWHYAKNGSYASSVYTPAIGDAPAQSPPSVAPPQPEEGSN